MINRTVGNKKERPLTFEANAELFKQGCKFNADMIKMFNIKTGIPKGVYHFKTHAEANKHQEECLAKYMAKLAIERNDGRY